MSQLIVPHVLRVRLRNNRTAVVVDMYFFDGPECSMFCGRVGRLSDRKTTILRTCHRDGAWQHSLFQRLPTPGLAAA